MSQKKKKYQKPKNEYNNEDKEYFSEFILIEEEFYNGIEKTINISKNIHKSELLKNKVNIMKLNNVFIYMITDNILGFGYIPNKEKDQNYIIYKVEYLMILKKDGEFNYKSEITLLNRNKDLQDYLYKERHINLKEKKKESIIYNYEGTKDIGIFYFLGKKDRLNRYERLNNYIRRKNSNNFKYQIEHFTEKNTTIISQDIKKNKTNKGPNFNFKFKENSNIFNRNKNNNNNKKEEVKKKQEIIKDNNEQNSIISESIDYENENENENDNINNNITGYLFRGSLFNNYFNNDYEEKEKILNIINNNENNYNDEEF